MVFDTTDMPYSKAKAKMYGKGPRAVLWPPGHPEAPDAQASQSSQPSGRGKGTGTDPETRLSLLIAHWETFANRLLRNRARRHMFETMLRERRRRAIIMMMMMMPVSQLVQWLLQQVMHQLLRLHLLDTYHH